MTTQADSPKQDQPKKPTPSVPKLPTWSEKKFGKITLHDINEVKRSLAVEKKFRDEFKEDSDSKNPPPKKRNPFQKP
jgi:hypothetical protein